MNGWAIVKDGEDAAIHAHVAHLHFVRDAAEGDDGPVLKFKHLSFRGFNLLDFWLWNFGIKFNDLIPTN